MKQNIKKKKLLAYDCKGCIYVKINKYSIGNNDVKYWKWLFAKLLDFCIYVLNQPVNERNRFNLENLNLSFHAYEHIFKDVCVI